MKNKKTGITLKGIEKFLSRQTNVILNAVDEKIGKLDIKLIQLETRIDKKLEKIEIRINQKIDKLVTILNKFLKRPTIKERLLRYK